MAFFPLPMALPEPLLTTRAKLAVIQDAIGTCHSYQHWLVLDEFPLDAGKRKRHKTPRIDVMAIKVIRSGGFGAPLTRIAYEIKLTRQDFIREIRNPTKRMRAYEISDYFYFAVPEKMIQEHEVPPECGLLWVSMPSGCPIIATGAKALRPKRPSPAFMMDVARRAYQVGHRIGAAEALAANRLPHQNPTHRAAILSAHEADPDPMP